nr:MAG: ORF1 [Torque teno midi virus]
MPFWWTRRNKWWSGRRRPYYKRNYRKFKRRRRPLWRRKRRRTTRRRRKRRTKVRRKRKQITVKQWQPDRIVKCKIKGTDILVLGAEGKQFACYTDDAQDWVPATAPGGGGFGVEVYTLQYFYEQYKMHQNIWTRSNIMTDLARYTGTKIKCFRHPRTDFIVSYKRQGPFKLTETTYPDTQPQNMLLQRHRKIVPSWLTKPRGKPYVTLRIKPPKLLESRWYFQETMAKEVLFQLSATACNLRYPHLSLLGNNQLISLLTIDIQFYSKGNWGNASITHYNPTGNMSNTLKIQTKPNQSEAQYETITITQTTYADSVKYDTGWFQPKLLSALKVQSQNVQPIGALRYNPTVDDGTNNSVWFSSVLTESYERPRTDKSLIIYGKPLWECLLGFANFVQKYKGEKNFLKSYVLLVSSPAIFPFKNIGTLNYHLPIDRSFVNGKGPYNDYLTSDKKTKWFPTLEHQQEAMNAFVKCGPFIEKLENQRESNWELYIQYTSFFKWGGTALPDQKAADPSQQAVYETPTELREATQIINPEKQKAATMLQAWDYRRGLINQSAIKRMYEDGETDTIFQTDGESYQPKKKTQKTGKELKVQNQEDKEIQSCLRSLFEENTSQEEEQTDIKQLIRQQQLKQQQLKDNILELIADLKRKQKAIQLHTGLLN